MRLVLLPGLNGSSALFSPLLDALAPLDCQTLSLPEQGPQDYDSLAKALSTRLGVAPFILLGESFSGPIAYRLALRQPIGLRGVIFAASFLTCPNTALALLRHLPIPLVLATQPSLLRALCLGKTANDEVVRCVQTEIRQLDQTLVHARLATLASLQAPQQRLGLPCLHLWPQQDRLVVSGVARQLANACSDLRQLPLDGPHFILQTQPQRCAQAIRCFMQEVESKRQAPTSPGFP